MNDDELLAAAADAATRAYAPYSNFHVGVAVETVDGDVFTGTNIENAAYPSGLCAEAVAIGSAVASGARRLRTVAVVSPNIPECYPCGQCRQRMAEFGVERIVLRDAAGEPVVHRFEDLLPEAFGPEALGR